jgi:two-component system, OmpR family, phosphate regulon sensor histidine kinase PhoR
MVEPAAPSARLPIPRLARAVAALTLPAATVVLVLIWGHWLDPLPGLIGLILIAAGIGYFVRGHLSGLEALRAQVADLARGGPPEGTQRPPIDVPTTAADLGLAIAGLDRTWVRRGEELRGLIAANEAILEAIPDPLILIGAGRLVTRANAAARALFGESIAGRDLAAAVRHPDVLEAAEECLAGRNTARTIDFSWPGPPEREFSVRFAQLPMATPSGSEMLLILRDVTALKQAEKMRADFVANVSHELRTPLAAIVGFVETLRGPARDDAAGRERFLGIMHEQAQRMARLVRDLLSLSRIEESEHTVPTDQADIKRVIGTVADTLVLQARSKGIAIDLDIAADLPQLAGDADQLAQVFQNLIDNAIKYAKPNGKVRIVARASPAAPTRVAVGRAARRANEGAASGWISVAVADDGEGIPREHLPRLTERFYRVDAARSRQLGGTGLGLAIVKHILNRHRGALVIESEVGRGSIFTVWLPASTATAAPTSVTAPPSHSGA